MTESPEPLSTDELAAIDATYTPFPRFEEWTTAAPHPEAWQRRLDELNELAATVSADNLSRARDITVRAAAFDTGAIEGLYETNRGLTRTVAEQAAAWEHHMHQEAPKAAPFFDAQLKTYELVMDAATQSMPINEAWIRRLHEELTEPQATYTVQTPVGAQQQPLPRGEYKRYPNHVQLSDGSIHAYAPVDMTRPEMARLVSELNTEAFANAHPILQASYAHYAFVAIHPFADGNGRVARALASVYFYRAASLPVLILADQRDEYFAYLHAADLGAVSPFVRFIGEAGRSAMGMVIESLREATSPSADDALHAFRLLLTAQGGLTHAELDAVAEQVAQHLLQTVSDEIGKLELVPGMTAWPAQVVGEAGPPPNGFRQVTSSGSGRYVQINLTSAPPATAMRSPTIIVFVSTDRDEAETIRLEPNPPHVGMTLSLREAYPQLALSAQHRMSALVRRFLGAELTELSRLATAALRDAGYRRDT